jgi:peptidoglycan/LPS O-acetylase OafA/YrhL
MGWLRLFLAIGVAVNHSPGWHTSMFMDGTLCVQSFYIVSGFLIQFIVSSYLEQHHGVRKFYGARALRIFPLYWIVAGVWELWLGNPSAAQAWHERQLLPIVTSVFTNIFLFGQDALRFFFYDTSTHRFWLLPAGLQTLDGVIGGNLHLANFVNTLGQSWSMALELTFYVLAPWLLRLRNRWVAVIVIWSFILRLTLSYFGYNGQSWINAFFPQEVGIFLLGALSCRFYRSYIESGRWHGWIQDRAPWLPSSAPAFISLIVVLYWETQGRQLWQPGEVHLFPLRWYQAHQALPLGWWVTLFTVVIALPFLFDYSRSSKLDRWVGELSYPVYLNHILVLVALQQFGFVADWMTVPSFAVMVAVPMLLCVDRPLERLRHRYLRSPNSANKGHVTAYPLNLASKDYRLLWQCRAR